MIYLDNAATTGKKPTAVIEAVKNAMVNYSANPGRSGHKLSQKAATLVYSVREKVSDFFGGDGPQSVVFTANCTHSLNFVIKGVLKPGDHCITSDLEHNAVMRPLYKSGIKYDTAEISLTDDNITLTNFEKLIRPETKLIICTAASNVIGKIPPISRIGALCKTRGILFAVDAAQAAGVIDINMEKIGIDFLCIAPHKGLYAPMGCGIMIACKPIENTIIEGGTGTSSDSFVQPDFMPERFESGTINLPAIAGINAGIDYIKTVGIQKIYSHEMHYIGELYNHLQSTSGIILYTPFPIYNSYVPVLSINFDGMSSETAAELFDKKGVAVRSGLHCAPSAHKKIGTIDSGTVRLAPGMFNQNFELPYLYKYIDIIKMYKK